MPVKQAAAFAPLIAVAPTSLLLFANHVLLGVASLQPPPPAPAWPPPALTSRQTHSMPSACSPVVGAGGGHAKQKQKSILPYTVSVITVTISLS